MELEELIHEADSDTLNQASEILLGQDSNNELLNTIYTRLYNNILNELSNRAYLKLNTQ